jgi:hypothetical protein
MLRRNHNRSISYTLRNVSTYLLYHVASHITRSYLITVTLMKHANSSQMNKRQVKWCLQLVDLEYHIVHSRTLSCTLPTAEVLRESCRCFHRTEYTRWYVVITSAYNHKDRLCGLVVRVHDYRSGGPGSIPGTTRKKSSGSGTGSTEPREYN